MNAQPESGPETVPDGLRRLIASSPERFEESLPATDPIAIEPLLEGLTPTERSALLFELVSREVELRNEQGESPTFREYTERFPTDSAVLRSIFETSHDSSARDESTEQASAEAAAEDEEPITFPDGMASTMTVAPGAPGIADQNRDVHHPAYLGKYEVLSLLGQGNFGRVYLARDHALNRDVAIKVPTAKSLSLPGRLEALLEEGQLAASLKHRSIVGVYDSGRTADGSLFIVLEYVKGTLLSDVLRRGRIEPSQMARWIAEVADAIHEAHKAGLIHRDLKPSNIIIDERGITRVTDFGLAVNESMQVEKEGEIAGTPTYMAPEQVRGEAHRLDGHTDIWALGVILYIGLTGRAPFAGRTRTELFEAILNREPTPPREIIDELPREMERICLKCLSKRMTDRYETALDLAEDLQQAFSGPAAATPEPRDTPRVVAKGLRSFGKDDASFFLPLLPGPRGRDGLPESIRFWKSRLDDRGDQAFPVGLLYGPSGGGKSSLIKAGLLPRLGPFVRPIFLECSRDGTESSLEAALRRQWPEIPADASLAEILAMLREGSFAPREAKVLLVLDQFEQWLHAHPDDERAALVDALRQCDGRRVQALLLVRDDFWLAITRFFREIEVPLREGENSNPVELFDPEHARRVLVEFGRACGRLPEPPNDPGVEASRFIDEAIREMCAADGRVTPVRLSLFAEVVRRRVWRPATLRELGGAGGIGVTFLTETFDSPSSPPSYRLHQQAALGVLQALLPPPGSLLRGRLRPDRELRDAAGYRERPADFADLIRILDSDLRMITPVDRDGASHAASEPVEGQRFYQIAHEFLITPVRQWIDRKQRATREGRARIRLETITASWTDLPGTQRLASALEWIGILWNVPSSTWAPAERAMMRKATRHHLGRSAGVLALAAVIATVFGTIRDNDRASATYRHAIQADYRNLPGLFPEIASHGRRLREPLERLEQDPDAPPRDRHVATLLLYRDRPTKARGRVLRSRLDDASPAEVSLIRDAFATHPEWSGADELRKRVLDDAASAPGRLRAACVLSALISGDDPAWASTASPLAEALLAEDRRTVPDWLAMLGTAAPRLVPVFDRICSDSKREPTARVTAAEALATAVPPGEAALQLARSIVVAEREAALLLLRELEKLPDRQAAASYFREILAGPPGGRASDAEAGRKARAAIVLAVLGSPESLRDALTFDDDPRLRAQAIDKLAGLGLASRVMPDWLASRKNLDIFQRQAVLMTWAETPPENLTRPVRDAVLLAAREDYAIDPDPGVHSAARLLLRRWLPGKPLPEAVPPPVAEGSPPSRRWEPGPNGHTFAFLPGPLIFAMGSPDDEPDRFPYENRHVRFIDRSIAVSTTELTIEQLRSYWPDYRPDTRYADNPEAPAANIVWYDAAKYCNWLSGRAGIPRDQWCYPEDFSQESTLFPDMYERTGFRLPSEAEWEYFTRAGTVTSRFFGESRQLLPRYAWTWLNSDGYSGLAERLLPNPFGLFDTYGSLWEWCGDGPMNKDYYTAYPPGTPERPAGDPAPLMPVNEHNWRIVRGGVFDGSPAGARSAHRDVYRAHLNRYSVGLRVVRTIPRTIKSTNQSN